MCLRNLRTPRHTAACSMHCSSRKQRQIFNTIQYTKRSQYANEWKYVYNNLGKWKTLFRKSFRLGSFLQSSDHTRDSVSSQIFHCSKQTHTHTHVNKKLSRLLLRNHTPSFGFVSETGSCFSTVTSVLKERIFAIREACKVSRLDAWHSGRTSVCDRWTFPVLRSTCSWWVTTYLGKPSATRSAN